MTNLPEQAIKQAEQLTLVTSVQEVRSLVHTNKATLIEGEDFGAKQQLAADVVAELQREEERHLKGELRTFFTVPSLNEEFGMKSFQDPKTGIRFERLPNTEELEGSGDSIIVLDEISEGGPRIPEHWMRYVDLPNTKFILLSHITGDNGRAIERERENVAEWLKLFAGEKTATGRMQYSLLNRTWSFVSTSPIKGH